MTHAEEQQAIARAIGQRIQECRELVERLEGGGAVRTQLNKTFEKVAQWCETDRAMSASKEEK